MLHLSPKIIQTIKITFHVVFISFILFELIKGALYLLPDQSLFFLTSDAVENLICALFAYTLYYFIFKLEGIWLKSGFVIFFTCILLSLASLKDFRIHEIVTFQETFEYFTSFLGQSLLFYLCIHFVNRLEIFDRYKSLEKELGQAKKQLLRNQLNPHFLFNAFNSLYSLSLKNHPETSEYILKLSSMMRYLTDETHLNKVPLNMEIDFIEKYIAIEKIRFGKDALIKLTVVKSDQSEKFIEPFLLITLVENAFKHGFYTNSKDAFVNINITTEKNELVCIVVNSLFKKQHFQETSREGKGLVNLKKRLQLLYPKNSNLEISQDANTYTTQLTLTLN